VEDRRLEFSELLAISKGLACTSSLWAGTSDLGQRTWGLIAASETYEAWVITWPPGGRIELHDHGLSSGAVTVASGELRESTVVQSEGGSAHCETKLVGAGESVTFGAHYVHDFANVGTSSARSVHVYAPRLTAMTYFDLVDGNLVRGDTIRFDPEEECP